MKKSIARAEVYQQMCVYELKWRMLLAGIGESGNWGMLVSNDKEKQRGGCTGGAADYIDTTTLGGFIGEEKRKEWVSIRH